MILRFYIISPWPSATKQRLSKLNGGQYSGATVGLQTNCL